MNYLIKKGKERKKRIEEKRKIIDHTIGQKRVNFLCFVAAFLGEAE